MNWWYGCCFDKEEMSTYQVERTARQSPAEMVMPLISFQNLCTTTCLSMMAVCAVKCSRPSPLVELARIQMVYSLTAEKLTFGVFTLLVVSWHEKITHTWKWRATDSTGGCVRRLFPSLRPVVVGSFAYVPPSSSLLS